jgi:hypothetical protein
VKNEINSNNFLISSRKDLAVEKSLDDLKNLKTLKLMVLETQL